MAKCKAVTGSAVKGLKLLYFSFNHTRRVLCMQRIGYVRVLAVTNIAYRGFDSNFEFVLVSLVKM